MLSETPKQRHHHRRQLPVQQCRRNANNRIWHKRNRIQSRKNPAMVPGPIGRIIRRRRRTQRIHGPCARASPRQPRKTSNTAISTQPKRRELHVPTLVGLARKHRMGMWIPSKNTDFHPAEHIDISVLLQPGETLRIASAPYEDPSVVCEQARQLSEQYDIWTYREIGHSAQGRPICVLETQPRDLTLFVDATMQSCEPVSWGILHVAHSLTIPTARTQRLLDHVQFCLMPITNPDGVCEGRSVTNAMGEVPKFGINHLVEGKSAPRETAALWQYFLDKKPDASIEVHAHFTRPDFTRSIGMHDKASMPHHLRAKAKILEQAIFENYHIEPLKNRKVLIDPRQPEHNVYGDKHICEQAGTIRTFLQAIPDSIDAHNADVKEMVETVAHALIKWRETGAT